MCAHEVSQYIPPTRMDSVQLSLGRGDTFTSCRKQELLSSCRGRLRIAVASLVAERKLWGVQASAVVVHGLGSPTARGICPD